MTNEQFAILISLVVQRLETVAECLRLELQEAEQDDDVSESLLNRHGEWWDKRNDKRVSPITQLALDTGAGLATPNFEIRPTGDFMLLDGLDEFLGFLLECSRSLDETDC